MTLIDIFYQGEGLRDIEHLELEPEQTFAKLKALLAEKHGLPTDVFLFLEDAEEPIDEAQTLSSHHCRGGVKAHIHSCRRVEVSVTFNGRTVEHHFTPATTVARVKYWAAERVFNMSEAEASEHVLQISRCHERPAPGTHLGSLASCTCCRIAFDLVPDQRVNGSSGGGER